MPMSLSSLIVERDGEEGEEYDKKSYEVVVEELREARREIEVLKLTSDNSSADWPKRSPNQDPNDTSQNLDLQLELEMSKLQLKESQDAQSVASRRLSEYISLVHQAKERVAQSEHERRAMGILVQGWKAREETAEAERVRLSKKLTEAESEKNFAVNELMRLKEGRGAERDGLDEYKSTRWSPLITTPLLGSCSTPSLASLPSFSSAGSGIVDPKELAMSLHKNPSLKLGDYPSPDEMRMARDQILTALPIPDTVPTESLEPFIIPPPYSLAEFLAAATGATASSLSGYHVFQQSTTFWCPEAEEHGFLLTPLHKCITNPKMPIIHRWYEADVNSILRSPTQCFFQKEEKWYYAGKYAGIHLAHLTPKEWDELAKETKSALLKETLSGRRNISPQVIYEAGQLYSVGALKVNTIGIQCVGFDVGLYRGILEAARRATVSGKWGAEWCERESGVVNAKVGGGGGLQVKGLATVKEEGE